MPPAPLFYRHLATAFLEGAWDRDALIGRGMACLGERPRWLDGLARRILTAFPGGDARPEVEALASFILRTTAVTRASRRRLAMGPSPWPVPSLPSPAALAEWLGL